MGETATGLKRVQIGWLSEALIDDDDLGEFIEDPSGGFGIEPMSTYKGDERINHSHGPISKPIPVYIDWADGEWATDGD